MEIDFLLSLLLLVVMLYALTIARRACVRARSKLLFAYRVFFFVEFLLYCPCGLYSRSLRFAQPCMVHFPCSFRLSFGHPCIHLSCVYGILVLLLFFVCTVVEAATACYVEFFFRLVLSFRIHLDRDVKSRPLKVIG